MSEQQKKIGIALSGGGYRASLFHLGAMRRLNELGVFEHVGCISSVSGGSILSGFMAHKMLEKGLKRPQFDDWEAEVAKDFREFVGKDIRTKLVARYFLWNAFFPEHRAKALAREFETRLTNRYLNELPSENEGTRFVFLATDFENNVAWEFEPHQVGTYKMGGKRLPSESLSIAQAVAASASFPPVFGPVRLEVKKRGGNGVHIAWLTDGGVYDNLGMEPVWKENDYSRVLISDGGAVLTKEVPKRYATRLLRYSSIAMDQVRSQRESRFIAHINKAQKDGRDYMGTLWRNASKRKNFRSDADDAGKKRIDEMSGKGWYGYDDNDGGTIDKCLSKIRTDLDRFTTAECKILENHGYFNADLAIRTFLPDMLRTDAVFQVPHSEKEYLEDDKVRKNLRGSHARWRFIERYFRS